MHALRAAFAAGALLAMAGCGSLPENIDENEAALLGAAGGATAGAVVGDGGIIAPALGALGGVVVAEEAAENDSTFDPDILD
jgi:hypothetical protein